MSLQKNRFNREKKKAKIRRRIKDTYVFPELADDPSFVGRMYSVHMRPCSCPACKQSRYNPWFSGKDKLTLQERRFDEDQDTEWVEE